MLGWSIIRLEICAHGNHQTINYAALLGVFSLLVPNWLLAEETTIRIFDTTGQLIKEITATKRGTVAAQDVTYSISVVNGEFLDDVGADDFYGFARRTGIQAEDEGPGEKRFIIRGVNLAGSASVGLYYDDIPTTGWGQGGNGNGQPDFRVLDLERIEILRGPQGTLYGAGSVGGSVGDYHLVGLRLGVSGEEWGGWSATLYANNLFDEDGLITYEDRKEFFPDIRPNSPTYITTYPRTIGLNLSKTF